MSLHCLHDFLQRVFPQPSLFWSEQSQLTNSLLIQQFFHTILAGFLWTFPNILYSFSAKWTAVKEWILEVGKSYVSAIALWCSWLFFMLFLIAKVCFPFGLLNMEQIYSANYLSPKILPMSGNVAISLGCQDLFSSCASFCNYLFMLSLSVVTEDAVWEEHRSLSILCSPLQSYVISSFSSHFICSSIHSHCVRGIQAQICKHAF